MKKFVSLFAILFLLSACSEKPSDSQIETALAAYLHKHNNNLEVKDFKKTNGSEKDAKTYIADVEYYINIKSGSIHTNRVKNKLTLIKTENGWTVTSVTH